MTAVCLTKCRTAVTKTRSAPYEALANANELHSCGIKLVKKFVGYKEVF